MYQKLLRLVYSTILVGPLILRAHISVYSIVVFLRLWESIDCHSGYAFPWYCSPLGPWSLLRSTNQHNFHHSKNIGAYGMFAMWDRICGTNTAYYASMIKRNSLA